jgi:hypothetical protein
VLVYFGYPAAHENDAERAVRAALELNDRLHELNAELGGQQLPEIAIRIGIHTGLIVIGSELASGGAQDHSIVGEAANLAARLQADAPTNSVIVSGETFEMISGMFDYESLGPRRFKGISRSIPIYKITKPRVGIGRTYHRGRRGTPHFVGRAESVERLVVCWNSAKEKSQCETILITGEAGVGKTRLATEIVTHPKFADANVLQIHCHDIFASTPLYSVGMFVWAEAGLTVDDDKIVAAIAEQREVIVLKIWHEHTFEEIGELLGLSPNTAAGRYRYGLQKLRACLRETDRSDAHEFDRSLGEAAGLLDAASAIAVS